MTLVVQITKKNFEDIAFGFGVLKDSDRVYAMVDAEGLKFKINTCTWTPGMGEVDHAE